MARLQDSEERAIVFVDWPQPAVVAEPLLRADDFALILRYRSADDKIVVVRFPLCNYVVFGEPNDEALCGHPLYSRGLTHYSVHVIVNSSLIEMLERRNSVHPQHDRESYLRDQRHYVFTFQDSTLECVVNEGERRKPTIRVFHNEGEGELAWKDSDG
jgi:hypothetical protein